MKKIFHHEVPPIMFQHKLVISIQISFSKTEDLVMHVQNSFAKYSRWYHFYSKERISAGHA